MQWERVKKPSIRYSTGVYYQKMLDVHVLPHFGDAPISSIEKFDVEQFLARKAAKGFCRNTLRGMRSSLSRVMGWAVENNWLPKNPCHLVALPEAGTKVVRSVLNPEQVQAIAQRLAEPYATLVLFLAVTGLRIGEAIAVRWSDIENGELKVRSSLYEGKLGDVKTKNSRRDLHLPPELLSRMQALGQGDFVFRARNGSPINPENASQRYLRPVLRELGILLGGWHDFRHTFTTLALREFPLKAVSLAVGHANTKVTTEVYQHINNPEVNAPIAGMAAKMLPSVTRFAEAENKYLN